jgi:4-hydroxy-tetrahydrodipicolinate synthase
VKKLEGVFTALITPFKNGEVDEKSLKKLVRFQLDNGVHGFVVSGTTAESPTLTKEEKKRCFDIVKAESGGAVPIVLGTGTNSTRETVTATEDAEKWGADAALVVVPYYNKPPQRGLVAHFTEVANATKLPVLLYNVPSRTITALEVESIKTLSKVKNIVGIKEATGDISLTRKIVEACGKEFLVTSGDDGSYLQLIEAGGRGIISVGSHILPKEFVRGYELAREGDPQSLNSAKDLLGKYMPLISQLYVEANPIPVKAALALLGIIETADMRLPLVTHAEPHLSELKKKMKEAGIL